MCIRDRIRTGSLHALHVQLSPEEIRIHPVCGQFKLPVQNPVFIGLDAGGLPGVEISRHLQRTLYPDILRQADVQRIGNLLRRHSGRRVKNCHVSQRMNAGIRPAGADDCNLLPKQGRKLPVQDQMCIRDRYHTLRSVCVT